VTERHAHLHALCRSPAADMSDGWASSKCKICSTLLGRTSNNTDTDTKICIMRSQSLPPPPIHWQSTLFTSARNYEYVNETKKERVIHNTTYSNISFATRIIWCRRCRNLRVCLCAWHRFCDTVHNFSFSSRLPTKNKLNLASGVQTRKSIAAF
jgi:hypothetical protein